MENVSQVAKSFKVDLCYCLVLNRRKQKEKNGSAILQTADGLLWILLAELDWKSQVSFHPQTEQSSPGKMETQTPAKNGKYFF